MKKKHLLFILYNLAIVLLVAGALELWIAHLLNNPKKIPGSLKRAFHIYYDKYDVNIIQYSEDCAAYDNQLFYKLKPGQCKFYNREFDIDVAVNKLGLRDDDLSLEDPEIILLGDSHAMGWGIPQESTFAQLLEKQTGLKTLNAGISSYGTAREMLLLEQLQTDSLKYLAIQYCENDHPENDHFIKNENSLKISTEGEYNDLCKHHRKKKSYYPYKHLIKICGIKGNQLKEKIQPKSNTETQPSAMLVDYAADETPPDRFSIFLEILVHGLRNVPSDTRIILFAIDARACGSYFVEGINEKLDQGTYPGLQERIILVDFSETLGKEEYFALDNHTNGSGHAKIAEKLTEIIMADTSFDAKNNSSLILEPTEIKQL